VFSGPPNKTLESVHTDWHGMAAISLEPSVDYRVRVSQQGSQPVEVRSLRIGARGLEALSIRLEIDPSQLR
jgi:hypothetical protein